MNYTSPTRLSHLSVISQSLDQQNIPNQHKMDDHDMTDPALNANIISHTTASSIKSGTTSNSSNSSNSTPPELSSSSSPSHNHKLHNKEPPLDQAPELWDVPRVCAWLESVGLATAVDTFTEQEITGDVLLDLNMDTLKELGISAYGRRYKIMTAISKLIATQGQETNKGDMNQKSVNTVKGPVPKVSISSDHSPSESILQQEPRYAPSVTSSISSSTGGDTHHRHPRSTLSSSVDAESLYQFPRKAPVPPSSTSSSSDGNHFNHRPISSTSLGSNPSNNINISRSNTYNTTSSNTGTVKSYDHSTTSAFRSQKETYNEEVVHPTASFSTPTKSSNVYTSGHDYLQNEMSARINHPADQKLSMASIDSAVQRISTDEFQAPEHEGWLHKQGDRYKTWNKRWFVLKGTNLFYFKSPKDVRMKGIINLRGYRVIVDEAIHSNKYCFKAQHEHERTFFFYTDTKENMKLWLQALMKATIMRDFTSPVMSSNQVATVPLDVAQRMRPRPPSVIMYKPPPLPPTNEPMQSVVEEEEPHFGSSQQSLENDTHYTTAAATNEMDTSTNSNAKLSESDENNADSDEDNIDPYQTAQLHRDSLANTNDLTTKSEGGWTNTQYVDWINQYLPQGKKVVDLSSAFRNGDTLIVLLETLSNKTVRRNPDQKGGSVSMKVLDNIVAAFKFMGKEGVVVDGRYTIKGKI
ncbi:unnamed protein product [Absidia cylindrospora]